MGYLNRVEYISSRKRFREDLLTGSGLLARVRDRQVLYTRAEKRYTLIIYFFCYLIFTKYHHTLYQFIKICFCTQTKNFRYANIVIRAPNRRVNDMLQVTTKRDSAARLLFFFCDLVGRNVFLFYFLMLQQKSRTCSRHAMELWGSMAGCFGTVAGASIA